MFFHKEIMGENEGELELYERMDSDEAYWDGVAGTEMDRGNIVKAMYE